MSRHDLADLANTLVVVIRSEYREGRDKISLLAGGYGNETKADGVNDPEGQQLYDVRCCKAQTLKLMTFRRMEW